MGGQDGHGYYRLLDGKTVVIGKIQGLEQGFLAMLKETQGGDWGYDVLIPIGSIALIEAKSSND